MFETRFSDTQSPVHLVRPTLMTAPNASSHDALSSDTSIQIGRGSDVKDTAGITGA
jgi:hypothetical protein